MATAKRLLVGLGVLNGLALAAGPAFPAVTHLADYAGRYPSFDELSGHTFVEVPAVVAGVKKAVKDKTVLDWVFGMANTEAPIFVDGGKVYAHACETSNCGDHDWTIVIDASTEVTQVCYHDAKTMMMQSRWYMANGTSPMMAGDCPQTPPATPVSAPATPPAPAAGGGATGTGGVAATGAGAATGAAPATPAAPSTLAPPVTPSSPPP